MAWFPDLSPYTYHPGESGFLNVGWLERGHLFPRGPVPLEFASELRRLSEAPVNVTRGFHRCQLCNPPTEAIAALPACMSVWWMDRVGGAEVHVKGADGTTYAAPSLIMHYVSEHQYQPPRQFIEAVLYQQRLRMDKARA